MQHYELKAFFEDMDLPSADREDLQQQFFLWPLGYAYPLDVAEQQAELLKFIKLYDIKLIIIDSLSLSMYGSVSNDDDVKRLNSFLNEDVRSKLGCSYVLIHHPRKQGLENPKKNIDIFGSRFIGANAQTLIALTSTRGSAKIKLEFLKTRLSLGSSTLTLERTKDRGFALESSRTHGVQSPKPTTPVHPLGKLFGV
jgi:RecA-family ATPase